MSWSLRIVLVGTVVDSALVGLDEKRNRSMWGEKQACANGSCDGLVVPKEVCLVDAIEENSWAAECVTCARHGNNWLFSTLEHDCISQHEDAYPGSLSLVQCPRNQLRPTQV